MTVPTKAAKAANPKVDHILAMIAVTQNENNQPTSSKPKQHLQY